jgi:hypothetical protein
MVFEPGVLRRHETHTRKKIFLPRTPKKNRATRSQQPQNKSKNQFPKTAFKNTPGPFPINSDYSKFRFFSPEPGPRQLSQAIQATQTIYVEHQTNTPTPARKTLCQKKSPIPSSFQKSPRAQIPPFFSNEFYFLYCLS